MKIISKKRLKEFWEKYYDVQEALEAWYSIDSYSDWKSPQDILDQFPNSRIIKNNRAIFNIKGNQYRLVIYVRYTAKKVYIRFIGTHDDYNKINAEEV